MTTDLPRRNLLLAEAIVNGIQEVITNRAMSGVLPSDQMRRDLGAARAERAKARATHDAALRAEGVVAS